LGAFRDLYRATVRALRTSSCTLHDWPDGALIQGELRLERLFEKLARDSQDLDLVGAAADLKKLASQAIIVSAACRLCPAQRLLRIHWPLDKASEG